MTEIHEITTWFTSPGWATGHEVVADRTSLDGRRWTVCGREMPDTVQAPVDMPACGQCLRRSR